MALTTLARIRALSGFRPKRVTGDSFGVGNGVNLVFHPRQMTVFVSPVSDDPQIDEISVYVDGSPVSINSVSENVVILTTPPANGTSITADYWGHTLSNAEVEIARAEVEAEIFGKFVGSYNYDDLAKSPLVSKIVAYIAAAAISDQAYNEAGANTVGNQYPPERLRRVGYALLEEVLSGTISLVDENNISIPVVDEIESWVNESTYGTKDTLFENDQFYADEDGKLTRYRDRTPWRS